MIVVQKKYFYYFCFLLCFVFSCKKDSDTTSPTVTITTPTENQSYNVNDIINVKGSVTDDNKIVAVSISLLDDQENVAHVSRSVAVTSPSMTIDAQYALDNIHLESGNYYLLITASDGTNDTHFRKKIFITAIPKVLKRVCVTSASSNSQTNFSLIDSTFTTIIPYHNFSGDWLGTSVSSYHQQVYECGNYTGNFDAIFLDDNSLKFSVSHFVSSSPFFTGFCADEQRTYTSQYDGYVKGYDYNGNQVYTAIAKSGYFAQHLFFNNGYLIAEEKDKTSTAKRIVVYIPTGVADKETTLTQDVVAFCEKDFENVFLFGNVSGQCIIQLYNRTTNTLWNPYPYTMPVGNFLSAVQIDAYTYLIAHSNGTIYKYEYQTNNLLPYLTGYSANQLVYDNLNNELYVVETNTISSFNYTSKAFHHSINSAENILNVNFLYNR